MENKLAMTPPMGWNTYNAFCCDPSEQLMMEAADAMISTGLKDAGYNYVNLDDGWMLEKRDENGNLVIDAKKFPNGLKVVTDYIHSKGLKAGTYLGCGLRTYGEKAGSLGFEERDAQLIADQGFDLLKYDHRDLPDEDPKGRDVKTEYVKMSECLKKTGREILFSICEHGGSKPWEWAADVGHMWRTTPDIKDGFDGKISWGLGFNKIIEDTKHLYPYAGPGHWNDPDMLIVGLNGKIEWQGPGCTTEEYRSHFALWCLCASPLIIGCDIRSMDAVSKSILMNRGLIGINQDVLGVQGHVVKSVGDVDIWVKPLSGGEIAVGIFNKSDAPKEIQLNFADVGVEPGKVVQAWDLWSHSCLGGYKDGITRTVAVHDTDVLKLAL